MIVRFFLHHLHFFTRNCLDIDFYYTVHCLFCNWSQPILNSVTVFLVIYTQSYKVNFDNVADIRYHMAPSAGSSK